MRWNTILSLPLLFILSAFSLPAAAGGPQDAAAIGRGAELVEGRCTFCHKKESLTELVLRCASREGDEYLHNFLKRHHAPDEQARADIIAFLTCIPAQPQAK